MHVIRRRGRTVGTWIWKRFRGAAGAVALSLRVVSIMAELLAVAGAELAALALARHERREAAPALPPPADRCLPYLDAPAIVVVPTYEEREALVLFVEPLATTGMDLLIVDDSSPDGTGELAVALAAARPWMHVLHRADKDGLGMAYRAGFTWCLEGGYGVIGQMDSTSRTRRRSSPRCAARSTSAAPASCSPRATCRAAARTAGAARAWR